MKILVSTAFFMLGFAGPMQAEANCENLSNVEKSYCISDYGEFLEGRMVAAYQSADIQIIGLIDKMPGLLAERLGARLQPSQVAFEAYRNAQCSFEAARALGGSGTGIFELACRNELTQKRISYLKEFSSSLGDI